MLLPATSPTASAPDVDGALSHVEACLLELGAALRARDGVALEQHATRLQRALSEAVGRLSRVTGSGTIDPRVRSRLATLSASVAAQREALTRAAAAVDRAVDVLLPSNVHRLYSNAGASARGALRGGGIQA